MNDSWSPTAAFVAELKAALAIEAEVMARNVTRRKELLSRAGKAGAAKRAGRKIELPPIATSERAHEVAANAMGAKHGLYYRAKYVLRAAEKDPARFGHLLEGFTRETCQVAYARLRKMERGEAVRPEALRGMRVRHAVKEIEKSIIALDGICFVLGKIKSVEAPPEDRARWTAKVQEFRSVLNQFARRLA